MTQLQTFFMPSKNLQANVGGIPVVLNETLQPLRTRGGGACRREKPVQGVRLVTVEIVG